MKLGKRYRTSPAAYQMLQAGAIALAEVEGHGVRVDKDYLDQAIEDVTGRIGQLEDELRADPMYKKWRRLFGDKTKLSSPEQLSKLVFGELGYKPKILTEKEERAAATEAAFEGLDIPFVKLYFKAQKMRKGLGTYLKGIRREMVDHGETGWFVHPSYNLNTVTTFRSSCSNPNWQNIPTRNETLAEMVRRSYIPRRGNRLVEIDQGQIEVRVSHFYHHDPTLGAYLRDPASDMHLDMAAKLFMLPKDQVSKQARHAAKNKFVFPEYYGDFYPRCAKSIWDAIEFQDIRLGAKNDGESLRDWLKKKGIRKLGDCDPDARPAAGTFEEHVKEIERWFWEVRYPVHNQWKKDWYAEYLDTGGFQMLTGFAVNLPLGRNDVINYPIQGVAFHVGVLWPLPRILAEIRRRRMRTKVVGQIHDCIVADCPPDETDDYCEIAIRVMTEDVAREFDWIDVPLEAEVELCPVDACWFEKKKAKRVDGRWAA